MHAAAQEKREGAVGRQRRKTAAKTLQISAEFELKKLPVCALLACCTFIDPPRRPRLSSWRNLAHSADVN